MSEAKTPERAAKRPRADTASKTPGIPEGHMLFGIPKKGRLNEKCVAMLKGIGLDHKRANRLDYANCVGAPVTIVFLPAHDIARYIADGNVDMGITGQDIIAETECEGQVVELRQLGFGACKLAVEAPKGEYTSVEEVAGKRIVTSFPNLTRAYFSKLENGDKTTVTVVDGSVEVACALGLADAVVDLVESGTTMRAAGLEAIATIMTTEAVLVSNPNSKHGDLIAKLDKRINGYQTAKDYVMLTYNVNKEFLDQAKTITPGLSSPTVMVLAPQEDGSEWVSVTAMTKKKVVAEAMDQLEEIGATGIAVMPIENCRQ